jgi:hypothetical protein
LAKHRSGSLNNIDCGKLSVNYDDIEDIGGNEQLYLEMEKLFVEYKEQEQAKSAIEDELDRRIREKIKPDVEKYKEKQALKVKDGDRKRDRTNSLNPSVSVVNPRSDNRRASTNSITNTEVPKNGLRSSSAVNSQCQISNSKLSKTASRPLEPRKVAPTGSNPSTAVVPPFSYTETSKKDDESSEDDIKKKSAEEELDPEARMKKTRSDVERELEQRIRAKLQESRRTSEREGRSRKPATSKSSERGRTPDRGRPPDRGRTPERGRTPVRGVTSERGRTPDRVSTSQRGTTPDEVKASELVGTSVQCMPKERGTTPDGNAVNAHGRTPDRKAGNERGRTADYSSASQHGRTLVGGATPEQSKAPSRGVTTDRVRRSSTPDPVTTRSKTPDPITQQRRCQTPDPSIRSRKIDSDRSRLQVRSKTPDPSTGRKRLNSTGSADSSDRQSSGADSNANLYASFDSLTMFSDSLDSFRYGSMDNLAKPRKDVREGVVPTRIPGPKTLHKSASQMSLTSCDLFDDDTEVRSITKNAEYFRKHRPSAPDVLRLKMQSPLITGRSTIVNKKLPSPTKDNKSDGIKAITAIHFV